MIEPTDNRRDEVEARLVEWHEAERAGVFRPTRVDTRQLMRADGGGSLRFSLRWVAAAAVLFLAATTVWTAMFYTNLRDLRSDRSELLASISIGDCLAGPRGSLPSECGAYDLDADGDVDLADLRSFQIAYAQR